MKEDNKLLHYKSYGEGSPVVILHGLFGMSDNWKSFARRLTEFGTYKVITVDLRNHGRSFHHELHTYEAMAEDLKVFLEHLNLPMVHLVGHSMGAKTAMFYACKYEEFLYSMTSIDMGVKELQPSHTQYFEAMESLPLNEITKRSQADSQLKEKVPSPLIRQFLLKNLNRTKEGNYQWKFNLNALKNNYKNILKGLPSNFQFSGKASFISGEKSDYILEKDHEEISKHFPDAVFNTIPGAGHWVHVDQREWLVKDLQGFLSASGVN